MNGIYWHYALLSERQGTIVVCKELANLLVHDLVYSSSRLDSWVRFWVESLALCFAFRPPGCEARTLYMNKVKRKDYNLRGTNSELSTMNYVRKVLLGKIRNNFLLLTNIKSTHFWILNICGQCKTLILFGKYQYNCSLLISVSGARFSNIPLQLGLMG